MTKYILHGGFTRRENESNKAFYKEFGRDVSDGSTILLVYFASREDDNSERYKWDTEHITRESEGKKFTFLMASQEDFLDQLEKASAVFFSGGSTNKLLRILRAYPDFKKLVESKTVAGSSAGAYALVTYGASHSEAVAREGLGFVPLRLVCHYESPDLPPSPSAVEVLKNTNPDLELVFLKDFEWKVFKV